ncbi:MAG: glycosyltransferase family 2 protein [Trueperaceae bacterium]|nr:MAG: glycosyltransferase family 2 protein [Trueperaceae bacterium]
MMTYNEADVIEETMEANRKFVDCIFALDGSDDGTDKILQKYPEVELLVRDREISPNGPIRDYHRQVLLEAARERYGPDNWFTLLHGDEIYHDNPRKIAELADRQGAQRVNWAVMQFFPHQNDVPLDLTLPIQERIRWYSPFWIEIRQFKGNKRTRYRDGSHGRVIPDGVGWRPYTKTPILKHYPFRSPEQVKMWQEVKARRGFSKTALQEEFYRTTYEPSYKRAHRFDGDFKELELNRQGNLCTMFLRWKWWVR